MKATSKKTLYLSILYIILGIVLMALSIAGILDRSIYSGMGVGILAVGIVLLARSIRYESSSAYREKVDIEASDERRHFLRMKAWSWTGYLYLLISAVLMVLFTILGKYELMAYCGISLTCLALLFWVSYLVLQKKY